MGAIFKLLAICLIVFVASYLVIFIDGSEQLLSLWGPAQIFLYRFFELSEHSPGRQPEINTPISFQQAYYDEILPNISITVSGTDLETAGLGCSICKKVAQYVHDGLQKNITGAAMMTIATPICVGFEKLRVCKELIPKFTPWVITVLANSVFLPDNMCAKAHFCPPVDNPDAPESVPLPDKSTSQQNIHRQNVLPNSKHLTKEDDDDRLWVVHLSDWHYDPEYTEGYDSECGEPVCCRPPNKFDHKAKHPAGKWGDYRCDVPKILIENLLESLPSVVPKIDYIFSTGDLPPHDVWAETPSSIKETTTDTFSVWKRFLAKAPFFPVIGNHEAAPVNSFPTSSMSLASISWLYNILADQWGIWLNEDVEKSIRETGFYSVRLPKDNLRLIGLNTNFWYKLNWWMIIKPLEEWDPEWQLTKVVAELTNAEALGEKVWILGHMSPSDLDAFPIYSIYWSQIVSRFNDTIAGQFFGHAHWDEYNLMYDGSYYETEDGKQRVPPVTGVAYVAPSVTTFKNMNPAFRLYEINKKTKEIMNHYTYYLDIEEANRLDKPTWKVLYDAKTAYSMADLSPQSWHDLSERFLSDHNLYDKFREHASRMHSNKQYPFCHFYENAEECRKRLVCKIRASTSKNGGPYSQHSLCKSQKWLPGLPDDWRMSVPDEISINVDVDKFMKSGSAEMKLNSIEEIKLLEIGITDDGDDDGVKLTNLPYFIVKMILRLIEGGDEAVCR